MARQRAPDVKLTATRSFRWQQPDGMRIVEVGEDIQMNYPDSRLVINKTVPSDSDEAARLRGIREKSKAPESAATTSAKSGSK